MTSKSKGMRRFFWDTGDRDFIVETCKELWPEEVAEVLHRADLACQKTFVFTHRWDMERCETEVAFADHLDWNHRHNGDLEWLVMLNRARYMSELGQAYWLTGEEKYAEGYIFLLRDWMNQNPLTEEEVVSSADRAYNVKDTWRKLDSGIRITNWLKGYQCVCKSHLWGEEEEVLFLEAVQRHGMYLSIAYTPHDRQSNWGFLESNGLFQLALLYPELEGSGAWLDIAVKRMQEMCHIQIFADGMHNEQCSMYHHEVLHCLFETVLLAKVNDYELPPILMETLNRMFGASLSFVQPDGHQPMLGDSDGTDIRDVLTRGAVMCQRGDLKKMGYAFLDYEGIWYFQNQGYELYEQMEEQEPSYSSIELPQSGYAFMRSDWSKDARYLWFDAGHMDVIRAHGHDDLLHLSLFGYGREFLTDPGRYTYMEQEARRYFKESFQHNTLSVDGVSISSYVDSWKWNDMAEPYDRFWNTSDEFDYVQGSHDGYLRLSEPVQVRRQILFVKPDYWIVVDTCRSNGQHDYTLPFHFAEGLAIRVEQDGGILAFEPDRGPSLRIIPIVACQTLIGSAWVSRNYNEKTPSLKAEFRRRGSGFTKFVTVLYPSRTLDSEQEQPLISEVEVLNSYGNRVPSNLATALSIRHGQRVDTVLFSHQGPRGYRFAGQHMSGEVLLLKDNAVLGTSASYTVKI
ncbi:Heparinase II/III-like protein [Fontibacillus panacisegetis]|uniref:Heparinase II/III-like protein n=1 Tax=Fontibacillus panacisegetis TaxID=670482 RepID=A0A1G7EIM4_9BACL|nr:alginate lyase family protein [Fontibacillus panacisegetis]SDE63502.1 Heparinase II/III-like protein [Fontibacillus panacisegetis]